MNDDDDRRRKSFFSESGVNCQLCSLLTGVYEIEVRVCVPVKPYWYLVQFNSHDSAACMTILTPQAPHLNARSDVMYMFHHVKCHVSVSRNRTSEELRFITTFFGTLIV